MGVDEPVVWSAGGVLPLKLGVGWRGGEGCRSSGRLQAVPT